MKKEASRQKEQNMQRPLRRERKQKLCVAEAEFVYVSAFVGREE